MSLQSLDIAENSARSWQATQKGPYRYVVELPARERGGVVAHTPIQEGRSGRIHEGLCQGNPAFQKEKYMQETSGIITRVHTGFLRKIFRVSPH